MPHQMGILDKSHRTDSLGLFLEMRLGKSLCAIRWAMRVVGKRLVVCPLSVVLAWENELKLEGCTSSFINGPFSDPAVCWHIETTNADFFLATYESLSLRGFKTPKGKPKAKASQVSKFPWTTIILDESTRLRNPQTLISQICRSHLSSAKRKCILSGLPNPESSLDFFEQMSFLYGGFLGCTSYWQFRAKYYSPSRFFDWFPKRGTTKLIREAVATRCHMLTRKAAGLPSTVIRECRYIELPPKIRRIYDTAEEDFAFHKTTTKWSLTVFNGLRRITGGRSPDHISPPHNHKINEVVSLMKGELEGQSVVIWFNFLSETRAVEKALRKVDIVVRRITGNTKLATRRRFQRRFDRRDIQVLCMQVKTGQYGLNLSVSSTAIYFSEPASHEQYSQSMDRIVHPKKKEPLLAISILARKTVDERIHSLLMGKRLSSRLILENTAIELRKQWNKRILGGRASLRRKP